MGGIAARLGMDAATLATLALLALLRLGLAIAARRDALHVPQGRPSLHVKPTVDAGLLAIFAVYFVIRPLVVNVVTAQNDAMAPTVHGSVTMRSDGPNDRLLVNRYVYHFRAPRRGDIVVFRQGTRGRRWGDNLVAKRVVGVAGDTVSVDENGRVALNGQRLAEPYSVHGARRLATPQVVPPGMVYLLGDNRAASADPIDTAGGGTPASALFAVRNLWGKATGIVWPLRRATLLPNVVARYAGPAPALPAADPVTAETPKPALPAISNPSTASGAQSSSPTAGNKPSSGAAKTNSGASAASKTSASKSSGKPSRSAAKAQAKAPTKSTKSTKSTRAAQLTTTRKSSKSTRRQ